MAPDNMCYTYLEGPGLYGVLWFNITTSSDDWQWLICVLFIWILTLPLFPRGWVAFYLFELDVAINVNHSKCRFWYVYIIAAFFIKQYPCVRGILNNHWIKTWIKLTLSYFSLCIIISQKIPNTYSSLSISLSKLNLYFMKLRSGRRGGWLSFHINSFTPGRFELKFR